MGKLKAILSATILIWFASQPSSAMPSSARPLQAQIGISKTRSWFAISLDAAGRRDQHLMLTLRRSPATQ